MTTAYLYCDSCGRSKLRETPTERLDYADERLDELLKRLKSEPTHTAVAYAESVVESVLRHIRQKCWHGVLVDGVRVPCPGTYRAVLPKEVKPWR